MAVKNECTSVAGHFDGHAEAMKQYMRHRPMQHVHGYSGSHWTLPSGNYSLPGRQRQSTKQRWDGALPSSRHQHTIFRASGSLTW